MWEVLWNLCLLPFASTWMVIDPQKEREHEHGWKIKGKHIQGHLWDAINEPTLANHCGGQNTTHFFAHIHVATGVRKAAPCAAACKLSAARRRSQLHAGSTSQQKRGGTAKAELCFATKNFLSEQCLHSGWSTLHPVRERRITWLTVLAEHAFTLLHIFLWNQQRVGVQYILNARFCGFWSQQMIFNFTKKIVWERKSYQFCNVLEKMASQTYEAPQIVVNCWQCAQRCSKIVIIINAWTIQHNAAL